MSLKQMQFIVCNYRRHFSLNITENQSKSTDQPTNQPNKLVQQSSAEEPNSVLPQLVKNLPTFYRTQNITAMFTTA